MRAFVLDAASLALGVAIRPVVSWVFYRWGWRAFAQVDRVRSRDRPSRFKATRVDEIEWRRNEQHRAQTTFFMKPLPRDGSADGVLMLVRYPAGQINPEHVHPVGHGMYVLQGELATHRGTFSPGTFVWFPANEAMWHGAGPTEDVVVVFSTSPYMTTRYLAREAAQPVP